MGNVFRRHVYISITLLYYDIIIIFYLISTIRLHGEVKTSLTEDNLLLLNKITQTISQEKNRLNVTM